MTDRQLACHRCHSPDLVLVEAFLTCATWSDGLTLTDDGRIRLRGEAYFRRGEIQPALTEINCKACGHSWHPRRMTTDEPAPERVT